MNPIEMGGFSPCHGHDDCYCRWPHLSNGHQPKSPGSAFSSGSLPTYFILNKSSCHFWLPLFLLELEIHVWDSTTSTGNILWGQGIAEGNSGTQRTVQSYENNSTHMFSQGDSFLFSLCSGLNKKNFLNRHPRGLMYSTTNGKQCQHLPNKCFFLHMQLFLPATGCKQALLLNGWLEQTVNRL